MRWPPRPTFCWSRRARRQTCDLLAAVNTAAKCGRRVGGVDELGISEFAGETAYDSYFTTPSGHTNVTFVASSGDSGSYQPEWPAASPNVVRVGGTTLSTTVERHLSE